MFSATFPKQMEALARKTLYKPIEITVGGRSFVCKDVQQNVVSIEKINKTFSNVLLFLKIILDDEEKYLKLLELLGVYQSQGSILVFVDTQEHADELMKKVMTHFYSCMSLHGGIDQSDRDSTITDFKNGDIPIIIATSVAARGLDVKNLILVVNYDCPNHYEDYVHRCGRTGRAGNIGYAYTFLTPEQERYAADIIRAFDTSDTPIPEELSLLWDGYVKKMEIMGKKVKIGGGFSGHGFKFDSNETQLKDEQKKMQKVVMGLGDSDEDEESQDIDQQIHSLFKSKKSVKAKGDAPVLPNASTTNEEGASGAGNDAASKLELAKKAAARLTFTKSETRDSIQDATTSLFQRGGINPAVSVRIEFMFGMKKFCFCLFLESYCSTATSW
jgi:ATP-dependent RNA helicase DDX46/PRP5